MNSIKAIIFDLGGVILNLDYAKTATAFKKIGAVNFDTLYSQAKQAELFNAFEKGAISSSAFRSSLKNQLSFSASNMRFDAAWNAMLLDLPKNRLQLINELSSQYNIFLLSNTNEIHIKAFKKIIEASVGYGYFENCFKKCYYSSEIGLRKPNADCFEMVVNSNGLSANKTLFIDDSIQHIEGAKKVGLKTYHLKKNQDLVTSFPDIIQSTLHL